MAAYSEILYDIDDYIALITLNRPERLNAWTPVLDDEFRDALKRAAKDDDVRAIVFTGAGRGFCAGADLEIATKGAELSATERGTGPGEALDDLQFLTDTPKPIIAAINGPAAGFGAALAIFCDFRFISEGVRFSTTFARRGLVAEFGIAWMLARQVGMMNALDMLTARPIDAAEADAMGFARMRPADTMLADATGFAREIAKKCSPRSFGVIKKQLYASYGETLQEARAHAEIEALKSFESEDYREGFAHFLEKREPAFTGR